VKEIVLPDVRLDARRRLQDGNPFGLLRYGTEAPLRGLAYQTARDGRLSAREGARPPPARPAPSPASVTALPLPLSALTPRGIIGATVYLILKLGELMAEQTKALATMGDLSLSLDLPEDLSIDEWGSVVAALSAEGAGLRAKTVAWCFRVGDAVNYGGRKFGEAAKELIDELGLTYWNVAKFASVARRVPPENRRLTLMLEHHRLIARLPAEEQRRWLVRADDARWSARHLASEITRETSPSGSRVFGPPLNFRGLRHEPINEQGVVFLSVWWRKSLVSSWRPSQPGSPIAPRSG